MIRGTIQTIPSKDGSPASYCFVRGEDGKEYFLHKSELFDKWDDLKARLAAQGKITVTFESTVGEKGLRAVGAQIE